MNYLNGKTVIAESAYINKLSYISGSVEIESDVSIFAGASLRGDVCYIKVGKRSNIQDNATVHVSHDKPTIIGENVTVGHNAIVHGAVIEDNVMIGMGAIVLDGAVIGENSIIGAGAVITGGKVIPKGSIVVGSPYKIIRESTAADIDYIKNNAAEYVNLAKEYKNKGI